MCHFGGFLAKNSKLKLRRYHIVRARATPLGMNNGHIVGQLYLGSGGSGVYSFLAVGTLPKSIKIAKWPPWERKKATSGRYSLRSPLRGAQGPGRAGKRRNLWFRSLALLSRRTKSNHGENREIFESRPHRLTQNFLASNINTSNGPPSNATKKNFFRRT